MWPSSEGMGSTCFGTTITWFVCNSYLESLYKSYFIQNCNLPVVLYGCETWSLTLREEHRLRVFENRVLRRIFGPKREEVMGDWRKLYNEELYNLYFSSNIE
jgi:hypothetical protein